MDIVLKGILSGVVLALLIGPVFFTILQTSIERGFWCGVYVAIGVSLSDAFYILICYLGLVQLMQAENVRLYMAYGGGVVLLLFGLYYLFIKSRKLIQFNPENLETRSWLRLVGKGFLINGLSPMVLFFWLATVGVATTQLGYNSGGKAFAYFAAIVTTVFVTDVIKAKLADKLRSLMTTRFVRILNIVLGLVLIVFAVRLLMFPETIQ